MTRTFNKKNAPVRYEALRECLYKFRGDHGIEKTRTEKPVSFKAKFTWGTDYDTNSFGAAVRRIKAELENNPHGYVNEQDVQVHGRGTSARRLHENDSSSDSNNSICSDDGDSSSPQRDPSYDIGSGSLKQKDAFTSTPAPFGTIRKKKNTLDPQNLAPEHRVFSNEGQMMLPFYAVLHLDQPEQAGDQRKLALHVCIHCLSGTTDGGFEIDINAKDRSQIIFQDQMGEAGKIFFGQESVAKGYEGFHDSEQSEQSIIEMIGHLTRNYKNTMSQKQVLRFPFRLRGWLDGVKPWASSVPFQPFEECETMENLAFVNCIAIVDWDDVETSRTSSFRKTTPILKSPRFTRFEPTNQDRCNSVHSTPRHENLGATILELDGLSLCDEDDYQSFSGAGHSSIHSSGRRSISGNRSISGRKSYENSSLGSKQSLKGSRKAEFPLTISVASIPEDDSSGITEMHNDYAPRSLSASRSISLPAIRRSPYIKTRHLSGSQSVSHFHLTSTKTSPARSLKHSSHHSNKSCSNSRKEADDAETQTVGDPHQVLRKILGSCSSYASNANEEEDTAFASILTRSMTAPGQGQQKRGNNQ